MIKLKKHLQENTGTRTLAVFRIQIFFVREPCFLLFVETICYYSLTSTCFFAIKSVLSMHQIDDQEIISLN